MVLFIMLYKVVLTFECVGVTIRMKAVEQFFPVARSVYYAVKGGSKTFKSVDDKCGHANAVYFTLKGCPCGQNSMWRKYH